MDKLKLIIVIMTGVIIVGCVSSPEQTTPEREILKMIKTDITSTIKEAQNHWDMLPCGGYIFRFHLNIIEKEKPELFMNFSGEPHVWLVFIDGDFQRKMEIRFDLFYDGGAWLKLDGKYCINVDCYEDRYSYADGPHRRIVMKKISKHGIQLINAQDALISSEEPGDIKLFEEIEKMEDARRYGKNYGDFKWIKPKMEYILVYDYLTQAEPQWKVGWPDSFAEKVYAGFDKDRDRIKEIEKVFTPKMALKLIDEKLGGKDLQK
ncbi:MAG: hypothetical protein LBK71_07625 [Verrucomicrobiales bacterium]|jgi:hypothetical protein|nr:hypothetical protein [Verrucomicrobiales bacterium]